MNNRQHIQKKHPSQSTYTPVQNLYQTRAFDIQQQPSHSSSGQENVDLDADHEQSQYNRYNLPYIPVNAPGTEPPPPIQTQLNSGEPTNYYQQGSADVPWYNRPTYPNIPVNAPGTEPPPPIQTKLTIGQPGDKYEQEADQVASQVVQQINSPVPVQSAQGQTVQREDAPPEEEEQLQAKSISDTIQREEVPEEEQLQGKSLKGEMAATPNLETSIQGARGSGQPLDENIRQPMEKAFGGVDFSQVKVHNDTQSDQLNKSIHARAFTTGTDVFFRGGEYNPGSRGGQELIAHELTHVVQQSGGVVQRSQNQQKLTSLVQENVISPRIQCWVLPPDWLDYIGLTIDVAERIYIELAYKEGEEKDFKRFVNNLFIAIDLIFATAPGAGGGGLALRASHSGAVVVWAATHDSLKLKIAAEVAKRMGWPVTKALQMANIYFSTSNKEEGERRDLESHENEGGHTEEKHVGKSENWLRKRLQNEPDLNMASSFRNESITNRTQGKFVKQFREEIEVWLNSKQGKPFVKDFNMDELVGIVVERGRNGAFRAVETKRVRVIIVRDSSAQGWHILTSFPIIK
jgi:hypothetical protein